MWVRRQNKTGSWKSWYVNKGYFTVNLVCLWNFQMPSTSWVREKSQCCTFTNLLWEIPLSPWCYRIFHPSWLSLKQQNPSDWKLLHSFHYSQSPMSLRKSIALLGKEPTGKPSDLFVSSFFFQFASSKKKRQSWLLTAKLTKRAWKGSTGGIRKFRTWPLGNLKGRYGGEGKFLRLREGLES